ncbi:MAG: hypothetical protein GKR93_02455 [Gammaproteobacteria bacterium]|nr:hypothetical protein [Gammaproteobacteria bacterium]
MSEHKVIKELAECLKANKLVLSINERNSHMREYSLQNIQLSQNKADGSKAIVVPVFDEYDDTRIQNPVLWLHLIVDTCEGFEQAANYDEWRSNEGYKDSDFFSSLYADYTDLIPKIRTIIGSDIRAIDSHHIEFNTDIAQALRNYQL